MSDRHTIAGLHINYDSESFVLVDKDNKRLEPDTVYASGSIVEMLNDGFYLEQGERFINLEVFNMI